MEQNKIISKLDTLIKQKKELDNSSELYNKENLFEKEKKESNILSKIVKYFHKILSNDFNELYLQENTNNFWNYFSLHFNNNLIVIFCEKYEYENSDDIISQKEKKWIYISILEKEFNETINEIYRQGYDKLYYEEDSLLIKYKSEIIKILKELQEINFINIKSKEHEQYLEFLIENNKNPFSRKESILSSYLSLDKISYTDSKQDMIKRFKTNESKITFDIFQSQFIDEDEKEKFFHEINTMETELKINNDNSHDKNDSYTVQKLRNFNKCIIDNNFYSFKEENNNEEKGDKDYNNINNNDNKIIIFEDEKGTNSNFKLILNPKKSMYLPIDILYKTKEKMMIEKNSKKEGSEKYNISNSSILYLNNFYKKGFYYKFFKYNLNRRPISLKEQNYQCYICYKRIANFLGVPTEQVFWCSYYLRFVCKNCIDIEYSVIPQLIMKKWCFNKFSISKKAKNNLSIWYDKPVIYFKKDEKSLNQNKPLNKIIVIKQAINNIFNYMKCENKFIIIENIFGEYKYLALKEYLFSLKDLVEIDNGKFFQKINTFKSKLMNHLNGECPDCKYDGEYCIICSSKEKIYLYNTNDIHYSHICNKSFHKKCIEFSSVFHHNS